MAEFKNSDTSQGMKSYTLSELLEGEEKEYPMLKKLREINPVGKFIIDNICGVSMPDGTYYHYSDVCLLLNKFEAMLTAKNSVPVSAGQPKTKTQYFKSKRTIGSTFTEGKIYKGINEHAGAVTIYEDNNGNKNSVYIELLERVAEQEYLAQSAPQTKYVECVKDTTSTIIDPVNKTKTLKEYKKGVIYVNTGDLEKHNHCFKETTEALYLAQQKPFPCANTVQCKEQCPACKRWENDEPPKPIESEQPKAEEGFTVGDWIWNNADKEQVGLVIKVYTNVVEVDCQNGETYDFITKYCRLATQEEVFNWLKPIADKKYENKEVKTPNGNRRLKSFYTYESDGCLWGYTEYFNDEKFVLWSPKNGWAEIVEPEKAVEGESDLIFEVAKEVWGDKGYPYFDYDKFVKAAFLFNRKMNERCNNAVKKNLRK